MKRLLISLLAAGMLACSVNPKPAPPPPIPPPLPAHHQENLTIVAPGPLGIVAAFLRGYNGDTYEGVLFAGNRVSFEVNNTSTGGAEITVIADGYHPATVRTAFCPSTCEQVAVVLEALPIFEPVTREQLAGICTTFQGLWVQTDKFGLIPWFEVAITSPDITPEDRARVYAAKHASKVCGPDGDTHLILAVSWRYDAPGQAYANIRGRNLFAQPDVFRAYVDEALANGFIPVIDWSGDGDSIQPGEGGTFGYTEMMRLLPSMVENLRREPDLDGHVATMPGFDGIINYDETTQQFGPWTQDQLSNYLVSIRNLMPQSAHCVEPSAGPLNGTLVAFISPAAKDAIDCILTETDVAHDDILWQGAGRLLGSNYRRPPDQPAGDDPNPPCYICFNTSRGPIIPVDFEWGEYYHVRNRLSQDEADRQRAYRHALGFKYVN